MIPSVLQQHPPLFYPNIFSDSSHGTGPNPVSYFLHHTKQFARGVIIHKNNFPPSTFSLSMYILINLHFVRVHLILFECTGVISSAGALLASSTWVPRMVPCDR